MSEVEKVVKNEEIRAVYLTPEDLPIAASLLYQAYHDDVLFQKILKADPQSPLIYEKKLRALIREELTSFWQGHQPLVGVFKADTLKAVACVIKSDDDLKAERYWHWRLKLMLTTGYISTHQLIDKEKVIREALSDYSTYHFLAFIAVAPKMQKQGLGHYLLSALDNLIKDDMDTSGLAVFVTQSDQVKLFLNHGFTLVKELEFNSVSGQLLFKDKP